METLRNLNKLWRTSNILPSDTTTEPVINNDGLVDDYNDTDEEESFFELELVMSRDIENEGMRLTTNSNAGRRVVPVEPDMKPHAHPNSPVSILKSAPKFRVSLFRKHTDLKLKPKHKVDNEEESDYKAASTTISTLISQNCSSPVPKPHKPSIIKTEEFQTDSSKRFSKDLMQKYLNLKLIKPFHLKVAKRYTSVNTSNKSRMFDLRECSVSSTSSASSNGLSVACKQLGKSRSASSMGSRRDESLVVEHDDGGIQSAILHCKRSFNSSRDSLVHSRSSSDSRVQEQQQQPNISDLIF